MLYIFVCKICRNLRKKKYKISGTLNSDCTKCTCEDHVIMGTVFDENEAPVAGASIYKYGHYDKLGETDRLGQYRYAHSNYIFRGLLQKP